MGNEFYYLDENGKKQDASLHEEMLDEDNLEAEARRAQASYERVRARGDPELTAIFARIAREARERADAG